MLYERWRRIAQERGSRPALRDLGAGTQWTFAELSRLIEAGQVLGPPVAYPQGNCAEFILEVLRAWRRGAVVCPLEPGQAAVQVASLPADIAHLKTTSASTGAPRLVAFSEAQLAADADNIVATMGLRPDWPNLGAISLAHSYGFSNLVLPLLLHGIPLILVPVPLPEAVRRAAEGEPGLTLAGVPALWRAWHEAGAIPGNIRLAISAGAPLPVSLERVVFENTGLKIHNFYGSSECGGIAYDAGEVPRTDECCVGAPLRNVEVTLNEDGCIRVRGQAVGQTYWPEPADALGGGSFQTSDLAELKDGQIFLRGRLSDLINVAGRKVAPATIERVLLEHPGVRECLVFGVAGLDAERTDLIVACVAPRSPVTEETLRQALLSRLPAWQVPREWWFVEALDPDQRGKLSREQWRQRFLARRAG